MIEYIRYVIPEDAADAFEAAYAAAAVHLAASPHCLEYDLARCHEDPRRYILRIRWDSLEGHLQGFRGSAQFREFFSCIRPYLTAIEEMQHYRPTGVAGTGAASAPPPS
jgi:hemoglobin